MTARGLSCSVWLWVWRSLCPPGLDAGIHVIMWHCLLVYLTSITLVYLTSVTLVYLTSVTLVLHICVPRQCLQKCMCRWCTTAALLQQGGWACYC